MKSRIGYTRGNDGRGGSGEGIRTVLVRRDTPTEMMLEVDLAKVRI